MTKEQAQFLVTVTEQCGSQEIDLRDDYRGRYMFSRKTYGVVVNSLPVLLADCINYLRDDVYAPGIPDFDGFEKDNMGNDIILY